MITTTEIPAAALDTFLRPIIGLPAWGVKKLDSSLLHFDFGEPHLRVREWQRNGRLVRRAYAYGQWYLFIYCCNWRIIQDGTQAAWSEDSDTLIERAARNLDGQKLLGLSVDPDECRSTFSFDLGGSLETWPYGDDPDETQWTVGSTGNGTISYRADGVCEHESEAPPSDAKDIAVSR